MQVWLTQRCAHHLFFAKQSNGLDSDWTAHEYVRTRRSRDEIRDELFTVLLFTCYRRCIAEYGQFNLRHCHQKEVERKWGSPSLRHYCKDLASGHRGMGHRTAGRPVVVVLLYVLSYGWQLGRRERRSNQWTATVRVTSSPDAIDQLCSFASRCPFPVRWSKATERMRHFVNELCILFWCRQPVFYFCYSVTSISISVLFLFLSATSAKQRDTSELNGLSTRCLCSLIGLHVKQRWLR